MKNESNRTATLAKCKDRKKGESLQAAGLQISDLISQNWKALSVVTECRVASDIQAAGAVTPRRPS